MNLEYFQMIDRIVDLNLADRTVRAEAKIPVTSSIFEGHFPGHPLMPGVLLIETMAQTSGWMLVAFYEFSRMPFLAAVREAKLRRFLEPGEAITIDARISHDGSGFAMTEAEIRVAGKIVCNAGLTFKHTAFPNDTMRSHMFSVADRIALPYKAPANG